jgi:oxygen-independent coproporphyrinogen-3 oxidase
LTTTVHGSPTAGTVVFDAGLVRRYDTAGPRYTSYPTAAEFTTGFGAADLRGHIAAANRARPDGPLSLYFHIPFCATVCYYCACNKVITANRARAAAYLERLFREIDLMGELLPRQRPVTQLHWGGGTPTYLDDAQMAALMQRTRDRFSLAGDAEGEYSIEVDPRSLGPHTLEHLRAIGFNRLSMGVQDLDPAVQQAVNRIQPAELTFGALEQARRAGFRSVSLDLIYGLPRQSAQSFARTLAAVIGAQPDRLSIFNYAHLPARFKVQRQIDERELPSPADKLVILEQSIAALVEAGYVYVGMDHFARADDELAVALHDGSLQRNFQGYATQADSEMVAMGASAISWIGGCYAQNAHTLDDYYARIDAGELATARGIALNADDFLRRDVINDLMCRFAVDTDAIATRYGILFADYFAEELGRLAPMEADGLVEREAGMIRVTPRGRLLIRNIAMVFDAYRQAGGGQQFSKVI